MATIGNKIWNAIANPTVRLPITTEFPLTGKTLGVAYVVGFILFVVGSFLPIGLFLGGIYLLTQLDDPRPVEGILNLLFFRDGQPKPYTLAGLMAASFLSGFAMQMWYLSRLLRKRGYTLLGVVGLKTDAMRGRTGFHTAWAIFWRALVTFGVVIVVEQIIGYFVTGPEQPTIEFARRLADGSMWVFFVIAAIGAPLLEEFAFRGILFQALRATFHRYREAATGATADGAKPVGRIGMFLGRNLLTTSGRAELWSVMVSGMVFSLWHMQFHPLQVILLFGMGCVLAEVFRRTGTLWTAIALHALNNGVAVAVLWASQV
jgi:membrane protease YdiL (CAAX protease family)